MWTAAGCLVVLFAIGTTIDALDRAKVKDVVTDYRVKSQNLHIDHLEEEIEGLQKEFGHLSPPVEKQEILRTKARVRKLEGSKCPEKEVSCGGDWPECVHHLLVCDGQKDCHNGRDEDPKVCDESVVHVGSSFRGFVHWQDCINTVDHWSIITITATRRDSYFKNRTFLRATVTREYDDHTTLSYTAKGYFVYAARKLVVIANPDAPYPISTVCTFNFGDNNNSECEVVMTASRNVCGIVRLNRV